MILSQLTCASNLGRANKLRPQLPRTLIVLGAALLSACVASQNTDIGSTAARDSGFTTSPINAGRFDLVSRARLAAPGRPLTIYIEGDGRAWIDTYRPSRDPTPRHSLALGLAVHDPAQNVAYLARPCQFTGGLRARNCNPGLWTHARFGQDVVEAMDRAVTQLKHEAMAPRLTLVGYSGGGTVAALIAARRDDVDLLVTVAGLLDVAAWTRSEGLTPLDGSLDPIDFTALLRSVPQMHFVGARDVTVPPANIRAYLAALGHGAKVALVTIQNYNHSCCWAETWGAHIAQARLMQPRL